MGIREYQSVFVITKVCVECGWFEIPFFERPFGLMCLVCPKCGGDLNAKRGRYTIRERSSFFITTREYTAFTERI